MTSTANRRRKVLMPMDIKKKFVAAICMLLIAAIMMISSTYAWFTLSTAPEVTGITTNVGANGNLEIALLTEASFESNADDLGIKTAVGDSMETKEAVLSNLTWGNLVDLSDTSYGLNKIILNPAALNLKTVDNAKATKLSGQIIQGGLTSPLLAPNYGADGRVINVQKTTTTGIYNNGKFEESLKGAGVRAVGVSSGITTRVAAYRTALSLITVYMNSAKAAAQRSLVDNGQALASLLVTAVADEHYQLTSADVAAINAVKSALLDSTNSIKNAIRQAALAYYLSSANTATISDDGVNEKVEAFEAAEINTLATLADGVDIGFLDSVIAANNAASEKIGNVSVQEGTTYSDAATQIAKLIDKDQTQINGIDGSTLSTENIGTLAVAILGAGQVEVTMLDGSGIYADIAKMVGNYTASGLKVTITYDDIAVEDMPTVMTTNVTGTSMLTAASTTAAAGDPVEDGGSTAVDDTYGYILDFGLRTNAAGSSLLLQQDEKQRIYTYTDEETAPALTQGEGTYIEFITDNRYEFSKEDVMALMSAVRVVFLTPNDIREGYEILGIAAPNLVIGINDQGNRVVNNVDDRFGGTITYSDSENNNSTKVRAKLFMYDLENVAVESIVADKEYKITLGGIKTKAIPEGAPEGTVPEPDFSIVELNQNKAKKISALVYIDGDIVDNTMVANAATTVTGKINLQFASSAELVPMENSAIKNYGTEEGALKNKLTTGLALIKANSIYTDAVAATTPTAEQTALLNAVTAADALAADANATDEQITSTLTTLGAAYVAAGGTNPFAG